MSGVILAHRETVAAEKAPRLLLSTLAIPQFGNGYLAIQQRANGLKRDLDLLARPLIIMVGDDTDCALGPDPYDHTQPKRLIANVFYAPSPASFSSIALLAAANHKGLIIETRPEQEIAWTNFVQAVRADMLILLCSIEAARQ